MPLPIPTKWRKLEPQGVREARWRVRSWAVNDPEIGLGNARFLAGSGRSGTTWLQEVACRGGNLRNVFEPFFAERVREFRDLPHGHYVAPSTVDSSLKGRVTRVLAGEHRSPWADHLGGYVRGPAVDGRVVKDIRTLPWLGWLAVNFPEVPIAHVVRHPFAVVASSTDLGWKPAQFDVMLAQPALRDGYLADKIGHLERLESAWERSIAAWCIENALAMRETRDATNVELFSYEELVGDADQITRFLTHFEIDPVAEVDAHRASRLSRPNSGAKKAGYAKAYWKDSLSHDDTSAAMAIFELFGFAEAFGEDGRVDLSRATV